MAQQESFIKLKGRIGDLTFYKTRDGYQVREAKGVDGSRIATDPKFQRTRENGMEFGAAGRTGKRLRDALRPLTLGISDSRMANRLTSSLLHVLRGDQVNRRGERVVLGENIGMLKGFSFNAAAQLDRTLIVNLEHSIDRAGGTVSTQVPAFDARDLLIASPGSTHFRLVMASLLIDFSDAESTPSLAVAESDYFLTDAALPETLLSTSIPSGSTETIIQLFGVHFLQEVNLEQYSLQLGTHNALTIVGTDHA